MFFDDALLWQPASPAERRIPSSRATGVSLPSWSWVGWRGDIDKDSWASGSIRAFRKFDDRSHVFGCNNFEIKPVCQWSCGDGKTWRELNIAHYKYLKDRVRYLKEEKALPQDWSMYRKVAHDSYFKYKLSHTLFRYPVAFGASRAQSKIDSSHLLSYSTRRISLCIGPPVQPWDYDYDNIRFNLCSDWRLLDKNGKHCGSIRLNFPPQRITNDPIAGTVCELIAISEGLCPTSFYPVHILESKFGRHTRGEMEMFYNVLWIEWIDGIAYRKALGQVAKAVWDGYPEEWIDVILG